MLNHVIKFIERNVDGCGTDAEVMVSVRSVFPLTSNHEELLKKTIEDIKKEWDKDKCDTDSIVNEAIKRVFGKTDINIEILLPDIEVEF